MINVLMAIFCTTHTFLSTLGDSNFLMCHTRALIVAARTAIWTVPVIRYSRLALWARCDGGCSNDRSVFVWGMSVPLVDDGCNRFISDRFWQSRHETIAGRVQYRKAMRQTVWKCAVHYQHCHFASINIAAMDSDSATDVPKALNICTYLKDHCTGSLYWAPWHFCVDWSNRNPTCK